MKIYETILRLTMGATAGIVGASLLITQSESWKWALSLFLLVVMLHTGLQEVKTDSLIEKNEQ